MSKASEALLLEAADPEMRKLLEQLVKAMNDIEDNSVHINMLLDSAIAYYEADRAYVIEGDTELVTGVNTHERCAPSVESQNDTLKDMAPDVYTHWLHIFQDNKDVVIPDMEAIKGIRPNEYKYFNDSDVRSLIVVPFHKRISMGFLGVDNPKRHITDPLPLRVLSYAVVLELNELKLTREKAALMQVSQYNENSVTVHLLSHFCIMGRGGTLYQDQLTQQGQALLTILLLHPSKSFSYNEIYDIISQDKESDNPTSVVNNAIYRLRSNLDIIGLKELVHRVRNAYSLNPRFDVETDVDRFLKFYKAIKEVEDPRKKLEQCNNALNLYKNPLPESLSGSIRWALECAELNNKFLNATMECVRLYIARGEYSEAYAIAHHALDIDPNEPEMMLLTVKAMKLAKRPGVNSYVKSIMQFLDEDAKARLQKILNENG